MVNTIIKCFFLLLGNCGRPKLFTLFFFVFPFFLFFGYSTNFSHIGRFCLPVLLPLLLLLLLIKSRFVVLGGGRGRFVTRLPPVAQSAWLPNCFCGFYAVIVFVTLCNWWCTRCCSFCRCCCCGCSTSCFWGCCFFGLKMQPVVAIVVAVAVVE